MTDEKLARLRAHDSNISRYRRLLKTNLSDIASISGTALERGKIGCREPRLIPLPPDGLTQPASLTQVHAARYRGA